VHEFHEDHLDHWLSLSSHESLMCEISNLEEEKHDEVIEPCCNIP
jgi:hypothetical protein